MKQKLTCSLKARAFRIGPNQIGQVLKNPKVTNEEHAYEKCLQVVFINTERSHTPTQKSETKCFQVNHPHQESRITPSFPQRPATQP